MNKVHFVIDEADVLKRMPQIQDALNTGRGFGCHLTLIYQNCSQLKECFPDGQDANVLANVTQVFFSVNDWLSAEYIANRCGETSLILKSGGVSRGTSRQRSDRDGSTSTTSSFNANDNWQEHGRKLLKPEEVMALSPRTAITFAPGVPPLLTQLIRHYEERPDSLWQRTTKGFKAIVYALALLGAAVIAAKNVAISYQYRMNQPPVRAVQGW